MIRNISTLNQEQASLLMNASEGRSQIRDQQILAFLLNTGLKIREFVGLNVEDVYAENRVRKTLHLTSRITNKPRKIPLTRPAREAVALMLEYIRNCGLDLEPTMPLLVSRQRNKKDNSLRITSRQIQRIVKTLREDAAIRFKTTPQTLRHTFAKVLLENGSDMKTLQKLLGHRSIKTTRELYGNQVVQVNKTA